MLLSSFSGKKLSYEMKKCGYNVQALANLSGVSENTLRLILRCKEIRVSTGDICALADALGYPVDYFVDILSDSKIMKMNTYINYKRSGFKQKKPIK